jgi:hypothetical protein
MRRDHFTRINLEKNYTPFNQVENCTLKTCTLKEISLKEMTLEN